MDASIREAGRIVRPVRAGRSYPRARASDQGDGIAGPPLLGLRVALVHDWLTGMRGGEKCLEVLCRAFPDATLYTLIHRKGCAQSGDRVDGDSHLAAPADPGHLPPLSAPVADHADGRAAWRPRDVNLVISLSHCVAKAVVPPAGVPHVCYCFTPMRYAWQGREAYLEGWSHRPVRRALARTLLGGLQRWDLRTSSRVTQFVAISETVRDRIARCYGRESRVIQPPVDAAFYTPDPAPVFGRAMTGISWSPPWCPTSGSTRRWPRARRRAAG